MKMKKIPHKKIIILMLIIIILIPFCLFQNKHLVITTYTYESEKLGADLDGYGSYRYRIYTTLNLEKRIRSC